MIRDMSRSTMIIVAVIVVAGIASGLAYTAMVINSDNSSSAEYGLVSFEYDGHPATASQIFDPVDASKLKLVYQDENKEGSVYFDFTLNSLSQESLSEWYPDTYVEICFGDKVYTKQFGSPSQSSITIRGDAIPLVFDGDKMEFPFKIRLSDGQNLLSNDFSDNKYHITVVSHHLQS